MLYEREFQNQDLILFLWGPSGREWGATMKVERVCGLLFMLFILLCLFSWALELLAPSLMKAEKKFFS